MKVKVMENQTLHDIAVRYTGSAVNAYVIAALNNLSATDELSPGMELEVPEADVKPVASYFENQNLQPATVAQDGIEYFGIEYDFVIE